MAHEPHYNINPAFIVQEDSLKKLNLNVVNGTLCFLSKAKNAPCEKEKEVLSEDEEDSVEGEAESEDSEKEKEEEQDDSDEGEEEEEKEVAEGETEEGNAVPIQAQVDDVGTESEDSGSDEQEIIMKDQRKKRGLPKGWTSVPAKSLEVQGVTQGLVDLKKDVADLKEKVLSWEAKMEDLLKNAVTSHTVAIEQSNARTLESVRELGFQCVEEEVPDS
ncbi:histone H3.v1-like [Chenopodium quinoa]|uniref:histone H3.v1-like n=1 Tax=Chenopodium quinoa TaxID=63459 RepID=UPI000B774BA6|nr:histone H3.v1-like [Chenopodium quinoa]